MSDPSYALQVAVAAALLADAGVVALVGQSVFDPTGAVGAAYPLIEIGDDTIVPNNDALTDQAWVTIHIWASGPGGRLIAKQIGAAVRDVLGPRPPAVSALTLAGFSVTSGILHSARYMIDDDVTDPSVTIAHGNLAFRFQLAPSA